MNKTDELITKWKELNKKANKLLDKHESFKAYNSVRLQMDKIEITLQDDYGINIYDLYDAYNL
jgi:hypothetical protein